jgi:hypothetical protein
MKQIELKLIPAPGTKPEFLATIEAADSDQRLPIVTQLWSTLPDEIILEGYTRDSWAADTSTQWRSIHVKSVDGRQKLPGFTKYLRDRQKTAYGRLVLRSSSTRGGEGSSSTNSCFMWVISPKQASSTTLMCRVAPMNGIPQCPLPPLSVPKEGIVLVPPTQSAHTTTTATTITTTATSQPTSATSVAPVTKRKKAGLLGTLVGAQQRTNQHLINASTPSVRREAAVAASTANHNGAATTTGTTGSNNGAPSSSAASVPTVAAPPLLPPMELRTAGQLLADFRQEMEEKLLDFDISPDEVLKVTIDVAAQVRTLTPADKQSGRVTMEILKYIVYEQAEEVNEEWIAHKEPTEFMDEAVIAIYKEGAAPPEVLEELNKGELPDEVRGQERALQEQRARQQQQRAQKLDVEQQKAALLRSAEHDHDDMAVLNVVKRDRRTIEEIQRDEQQQQQQGGMTGSSSTGGNKRQRMD